MGRREHRAPEQPTNRLGAQLLRTALAPLHLTVREPLLAAVAPGSGQRLSRRKSRGERSNDHISCGLFDPDSKVHMPRAPYGMLLKGGPDKSVPLANPQRNGNTSNRRCGARLRCIHVHPQLFTSSPRHHASRLHAL